MSSGIRCQVPLLSVLTQHNCLTTSGRTRKLGGDLRDIVQIRARSRRLGMEGTKENKPENKMEKVEMENVMSGSKSRHHGKTEISEAR